MNPSPYELRSDLPEELADLSVLALDLRWSWSHVADELWRQIDEPLWLHTRNPWLILQSVSLKRLKQLAADNNFQKLLQTLRNEQQDWLEGDSWYARNHTGSGLTSVAYFCMEYGISEALPLYSGGLGILAGDHLKTCSELGIPLQAIGLLYQQGYFRQALDSNGNQLAYYPYNDPSLLPLVPLRNPDGEWLTISLQLPGRTLLLKVWQVSVGRIVLYLLDSNHPLNIPSDRNLTGELYGGGSELRLLQEIILGMGGYKLLNTLGKEPQICHLNEGHAAFVVLERARLYAQQNQLDFHTALTATRAGNLFTTHTPVAAGFDCFPEALIKTYLGHWVQTAGIAFDELMSLGRYEKTSRTEPFNMACLAIRGSGAVNGVSQLHGQVSRHLFQPLFPRWPVDEVPVGYVTNGVHVPSRDAPESDKLWTEVCGKERWRGELQDLRPSILRLHDKQLWEMRSKNRLRLINWIRERHSQLQTVLKNDSEVLDPNALTLGFARRFATYKRPNLLLHDKARLAALLNQHDHPVQLIIAGKAHPKDHAGQALIREWIHFIRDYKQEHRIFFLEDYDMIIANQMVEGVDVWLNTPRRPWEACGTSGMKVLVNGGVNLSELDGWWAEAWHPEVGWALGDGQEHDSDPSWDHYEAECLYHLLEHEVIPDFYQRNAQGIPESWITRMRNSMAELTPAFSSNRMVREYLQDYYLPMAKQLDLRTAEDGAIAKSISTWQQQLKQHWADIHFGNVQITSNENQHHFRVQLYLDDIDPDTVRVELYADSSGQDKPERYLMEQTEKLSGAINGFIYEISVPQQRPASDYTVRLVPWHQNASTPLEENLILWQR